MTHKRASVTKHGHYLSARFVLLKGHRIGRWEGLCGPWILNHRTWAQNRIAGGSFRLANGLKHPWNLMWVENWGLCHWGRGSQSACLHGPAGPAQPSALPARPAALALLKQHAYNIWKQITKERGLPTVFCKQLPKSKSRPSSTILTQDLN